MTERPASATGYAVKRRGQIDLETISDFRKFLVRNLNRPAGERVIAVRVTEIKKNAKAVLSVSMRRRPAVHLSRKRPETTDGQDGQVLDQDAALRLAQ